MYYNKRFIECYDRDAAWQVWYYVDPIGLDRFNAYIRENYMQLLHMFHRDDMELIYLPKMASAVGSAVVEYVAGVNCVMTDCSVGHFRGVLPDKVLDSIIGPSLVHYEDLAGGYEIIELSQKAEAAVAFSALLDEIHKGMSSLQEISGKFGSISPVEDSCDASPMAMEPMEECCYEAAPAVNFSLMQLGSRTAAEKDLDEENLEMINNIRRMMDRLRDRGISEDMLRKLLRPAQQLSRLLVTRDYSIRLVDYDNKEVKLTPIQKALLILYINHPEGIAFKMLGDYKDELMNVYHSIDGWNYVRQRRRIENLCDPLRNTINENVSRIRNAFRAIVDDSIAVNYYISGKQGQEMRVVLDRSMVKFE